MSQPLLLTLTSEGRSYSSSFDETTQSLLWISDSLVAGEDNALAHVGTTGQGPELVAGRGCGIVSTDGAVVERARLEEGAGAVFSIQAQRLDDPAILYVRPSSQGIRTYVKLGFSCDADIV
ncbi:MAG: hypothetical protein ACI364_06890, partial [Coriobacteriales bacterium]